MVAGIAILVLLGQVQNYEHHPFEKGIAAVGELFQNFSAL